MKIFSVVKNNFTNRCSSTMSPLRRTVRRYAFMYMFRLLFLVRRLFRPIQTLIWPTTLPNSHGMPNASNILVGPPKDLSRAPRGNVARFVLERMSRHRSRVFVHDFVNGIKLTYGETIDQSVGLQKALAARGLKKQDCVLAVLRNRVEYPAVFYATALNQAILATAVTSCSEEHLMHTINNCMPKFIFVEADLLEKAQSALARCTKKIGTIQPTFVVYPLSSGDNVPQDTDKQENVLSVVEFLNIKDATTTVQPLDTSAEENNVALILYTSGTTGPPKGVALTHRCLAERYLAIQRKIPFQTLCIHTPMCHQMAFSVTCFFAAPNGNTVVFTQCPPFEAEEIFRCINDIQPLFILATPPIMVLMMKSPLRKRYQLDSFFVAGFGASPFGKNFMTLWKKTYPQCGVNMQVYASTEFSEATFMRPDDELVRSGAKDGSCGRVAPGVRLKICDLKSGLPLGPNAHGEVRVDAGGDMLNSYWKMPDKTANYFDSDGFVKTGDYGYYDDDGFVYVLDRIPDLIYYSPTDIVCPSNIEGRIIMHDDVADVGVVGVALPSTGSNDKTVPRAYVALVEGATVSAEEVAAFADRQTERDCERLRGGVRIIEQLPRSTASKIQHNVLRDMAIKEWAATANV